MYNKKRCRNILGIAKYMVAPFLGVLIVSVVACCVFSSAGYAWNNSAAS